MSGDVARWSLSVPAGWWERWSADPEIGPMLPGDVLMADAARVVLAVIASGAAIVGGVADGDDSPAARLVSERVDSILGAGDFGPIQVGESPCPG